jgi:hypothetical protein
MEAETRKPLTDAQRVASLEQQKKQTELLAGILEEVRAIRSELQNKP